LLMERNRARHRVRIRGGILLSLLGLTAGLFVSTRARAQDDGPPVLPDSAAAVQIEERPARPDSEGYVAARRPLLAASEVVAVNALVWSYDRYIRENGTNPGFRIGFNSFEENIKNGFEFDDNNFSTNMYAHPSHGDLYFNAARSNGMSYWGSVPYTWAGSFMWEYFGEVHHAALNDWILTSMGGMTLG